jgi:hypothetical protein
MTFGFIITRHVNSETTNKYWNQSVKLIRKYYPFRQIKIIDDNSNYSFVKADFEYKNLQVIQSEYPGRGELLPYIYFMRFKWFDNAIITHDSVFIHSRIPFETFTFPVMPLWHHTYDKENLPNLLRIVSKLKNNGEIKNHLTKYDSNLSPLGLIDNEKFILCFGVQSYINLKFLLNLENKYAITGLIDVITCRTDRCSLERIMGLLFCQEYPNLKNTKSLFGSIFKHYKNFSYNYEKYIRDFSNKKMPHKFVKVWTGR